MHSKTSIVCSPSLASSTKSAWPNCAAITSVYILAKYEGGRLPDAAYHEAEILNNKINQRFSALMERDLPGLSLPEQALGAH